MIQNNSLGKKIALTFACALCILLGMVILGFYSYQQDGKRFLWINHTFRVISELQKTQSDIQELGRIQREYVLTKQPDYLERFRSLEDALVNKILTLKTLIADNPAQTENLAELEVLIRKLKTSFLENIELINRDNPTGAINSIKTGRGQVQTVAIVEAIFRMIDLEEKLLAKRIQKQEAFKILTNRVLILSALFTFVLILAALFLLTREFKRRMIIQNSHAETLALQRVILNSTSLGVIATDAEGKITLFNPAAEALLGYKADEVTGKGTNIFHVPEEIQARHRELEARRGTTVPFHEVFTSAESDYWTYRKKTGEHIPVKLSVSTLKGQDNELMGFVGLCYDVSSELAYEQEILRARDQAQAEAQSKSEFLANMTHEIRTPMNAILGMAELLKETRLDEEQARYLEILQRAGEDLLTIINDILDLSRIESGHFELDSKPFSLNEVILKAVEIMSLKAHQKNLELIVDISDDFTDEFMGDRHRLTQILLNLLGNAIKFTKKGEVILSVKKDRYSDGKRLIHFTVEDTGIGMGQDKISRLFERFSQADSSITKEFGGTGLGLNITKKLILLMNGTISVESKEQVGTKISFSLEFVESNHTDWIAEPVKSLTGRTILVVDTSKNHRLIIRKLIEDSGGVVLEAESAHEGVALLKAYQEKGSQIDLVLLDYRMADKDGHSFMETLRSSERAVPQLIMMITSDNRVEDLIKVRNLGIKSYLVKPVLRKALMAEIDKLLASASMLPHDPQESVFPGSVPLKILLVDDNDENRVVIKAYFRSLNWDIHEARNGAEAIEQFKKMRFDIIFMDMQMPVIDGYTATTELRKVELDRNIPFTPILALTAYGFEKDVEKSFGAGCNEYLPKPVSKSELLQKIDKYTREIDVHVDPDLMDIIPEFLERRRTELKELRPALVGSEFSLIAQIGHKLKGSAGSYGFSELSEIGRRLEEGGLAGNRAVTLQALMNYEWFLARIKIN